MPLLETEVMSTLLLFPGNYVSSFCLSAVRLLLCVLAKFFFFTQGLPRFSFFNSCACLGLKCILLTGRWSKIRRLNEAKMGSCPSVQTEVGSFSMDMVHRAAWHWWEVNRNITQMVKHTDEILSSRMSSSCQCVSSILSFSSGQDESGWLIMTI